MARMNGDFNLDGKFIFPSGADDSNLIRVHAAESAKGIGASGQIRFVKNGDEEGYWYLYNHPQSDWSDFDEGSAPSGQRIATLADLSEGGASSLNQLTDVSVPNPSGGQALVYDGTEWIAANAPVLVDVHNQTGGALTKGTAVYIT